MASMPLRPWVILRVKAYQKGTRRAQTSANHYLTLFCPTPAVKKSTTTLIELEKNLLSCSTDLLSGDPHAGRSSVSCEMLISNLRKMTLSSTRFPMTTGKR